MELMITVAIVGILLTVGVPSLRAFVQGNQLIASTNELVSALHIARSEAIKLNNSVSICTSNSGVNCAGAGANNWANGWIVFVDDDGDGATAGNLAGCTAATIGGECLLRVQDNINDPQITVRGRLQSNNAVMISALTFTSRGVPMDNLGASQSGTFSLCRLDANNNMVDSRAVILGLPGRARVSDNASVITCSP